MKVCVLGATGYVGRNLAPRLLSDGHRVVCLIRGGSRSVAPGAEIVAGDAAEYDDVERAMRGCDRAVQLIHSMGGNTQDFEALDATIAGHVVRAADRHQLRQLVYLGGLGNRQQTTSAHLRSRHEVARILGSGLTPLTELRAGVIIGAGSASFEMIRTLVERLPIMICPRWVNVNTQPIAIEDVLSYLQQSLGCDTARGRSFDIGGPDILSYRQMMLRVGRQLGLRRLIIPVPVLTPWLSSHWVNLVTTTSAPLARALIESVRSETVCEDSSASRVFNVTSTGFDTAVRRALHDPSSEGAGTKAANPSL